MGPSMHPNVRERGLSAFFCRDCNCKLRDSFTEGKEVSFTLQEKSVLSTISCTANQYFVDSLSTSWYLPHRFRVLSLFYAATALPPYTETR